MAENSEASTEYCVVFRNALMDMEPLCCRRKNGNWIFAVCAVDSLIGVLFLSLRLLRAEFFELVLIDRGRE